MISRVEYDMPDEERSQPAGNGDAKYVWYPIRIVNGWTLYAPLETSKEGEIPEREEDTKIQSKFGRRNFLTGFGLVAAGGIIDASMGFPYLRRAVREIDKRVSQTDSALNNTPPVLKEENLEEKKVITPSAEEHLGIPEPDAKVLDSDVVVISGPDDDEPLLKAKVEHMPNLKALVTYHRGEQSLVAGLSEEDMKNVKLPMDKEIPVPPPIEVTYWDNNKTILSVPRNIWEAVLFAWDKTMVNPYLLAVLSHSETLFKSEYMFQMPSPAGALGPFQFMPGTWKLYGEGNILDPLASAAAAGKMLRAIGLANKFNEAIKSVKNGDQDGLTEWRQAFIDNFTGRDGNPCWNQHERQAEYVFDTAMKLMAAGSKIS